MSTRLTLALPPLALAGLIGVVTAQAPSPAQDLKATIVLQGYPCDQLAASKRNGDSDYTVSCKDGNHYHVFVDAKGRVIVKKL
jgi:hypothetical protein